MLFGALKMSEKKRYGLGPQIVALCKLSGLGGGGVGGGGGVQGFGALKVHGLF